MARTAIKSDAVPQLATLPERVSVLETKVDNIDGKICELKDDVKEMHDCLDRTRDGIMAELKSMGESYEKNRDNFYAHANKLHEEDRAAHATLSSKIIELEKAKHKFMLYMMMALAFAAGAGWIGHMDMAKLIKFVGL